ncbi:MAG: hypothetical protein JWR34_4320 [Mycobacterium sp.]|nr:hypothetical protein [Mycobacterium sp.]
MKLLYHYTSIERWRLIADAGRLKTTESNLSLGRQHVGPDVVWLTTDPDCQHGHGLQITLDGTDKTRVRIAVELRNRDVHKWGEWAHRHGMDPKWRRNMIEAADGGAGTWRVVEKPVPAAQWVEVVDREQGTVLWRRDDERDYQDDLNTAALSDLLGVPPFLAEEVDGDVGEDEERP